MKTVRDMPVEVIKTDIIDAPWNDETRVAYNWVGAYPVIDTDCLDNPIIEDVVNHRRVSLVSGHKRDYLYWVPLHFCYTWRENGYQLPKRTLIEWNDLCKSCKMRVNKRKRAHQARVKAEHDERVWRERLAQDEKWKKRKGSDTESWKASTKNGHYKQLRALMDEGYKSMNCLSCVHNTGMQVEYSREYGNHGISCKVECDGYKHRYVKRGSITLYALDRKTRDKFWNGKRTVIRVHGCPNYQAVIE